MLSLSKEFSSLGPVKNQNSSLMDIAFSTSNNKYQEIAITTLSQDSAIEQAQLPIQERSIQILSDVDTPKKVWSTTEGGLSKEKMLEGKDCDALKASVTTDSQLLSLPIEGSSERRAPKMSIFLCNVGSGHISGAKALVQSMPECEFQIIDVYKDLFSKLESLRKISDKFSHVNITNSLAKNEHYGLLNFGAHFSSIYFQLHKRGMKKILREYVEREKPDMLISDIPILNGLFISIGKEYNIPVRVVTLDTGIQDFVSGISDEDAEYEHFGMTYFYDIKEARGILGVYPIRK